MRQQGETREAEWRRLGRPGTSGWRLEKRIEAIEGDYRRLVLTVTSMGLDANAPECANYDPGDRRRRIIQPQDLDVRRPEEDWFPGRTGQPASLDRTVCQAYVYVIRQGGIYSSVLPGRSAMTTDGEREVMGLTLTTNAEMVAAVLRSAEDPATQSVIAAIAATRTLDLVVERHPARPGPARPQ